MVVLSFSSSGVTFGAVTISALIVLRICIYISMAVEGMHTEKFVLLFFYFKSCNLYVRYFL